MHTRTFTKVVVALMVVAAGLATAIQVSAQQHTRYKLIDLGTFGGPSSVLAPTIDGGPENPGRALTHNGVVVGVAETNIPDPFAPNLCNSSDCLVSHAFRYEDGVLTDLGALNGLSTNGSLAAWINDRGWIAGASSTGTLDPLSGNPGSRSVLWRNGEIVDWWSRRTQQPWASRRILHKRDS